VLGKVDFLYKTAQNEAGERRFTEQMSEFLLCAQEVRSNLDDPNFDCIS
jgi:hypothetical protein